MIVSIVLTIFTYFVLKANWYDNYPWLHWLPFGASFTIAPSFYLYIKYLVGNHQFRRVEILHFSPIILNYLHSVYHLIYGRTIYHVGFHNFTEAIQLFAIFPGIFYLYYTRKEIKKYHHNILNHFSSIEKRTLNWAKSLLNLFVSIYILILVFIIVDSELLFNYQLEFSQTFLMPYDEILVVSYIIGMYFSSIGTYHQQQVPKLIPINNTSTYSKKNLKELADKIQKTIEEEQLYTNPNVSLRFLEDHLTLSAKEISLTLNHYFHKNFYEYINTFRVEMAKEKLTSSTNQNLTIEAIGYDSGFNSKATFYRIFKEHTGKSPGAYRVS